jgi:hypothetical protein
MAMISVTVLVARRALATSEFSGYVALTELNRPGGLTNPAGVIAHPLATSNGIVSNT